MVGEGIKKAPSFSKKGVARVTGLEPATSGVTGRRSNQLSYTRSLCSSVKALLPWDGVYLAGYGDDGNREISLFYVFLHEAPLSGFLYENSAFRPCREPELMMEQPVGS